ASCSRSTPMICASLNLLFFTSVSLGDGLSLKSRDQDGGRSPSAHRLYEAAGFVDIPPYPNAEVPEALHYDWRFMRLGLGPAIQA
ncbi:MAG: hypothetical protein ACK58O_12310, partial [Brevundimonas sp.]